MMACYFLNSMLLMDGLQQFSLCKTYGCIIHVIHECSTKNTKTRLDIHSKTSLQSQHNKAEKEKRRRDCLAKEQKFGREHTDVDIRNTTIFSFVVKLPSVIAHEQRWPLGTVLEMIDSRCSCGRTKKGWFVADTSKTDADEQRFFDATTVSVFVCEDYQKEHLRA